MNDPNPQRPDESVEEWRERLRCLNSSSTRYALQRGTSPPPLLSGPIMSADELAELSGIPADQIADPFDPDNTEYSVGYRFMCGGNDD